MATSGATQQGVITGANSAPQQYYVSFTIRYTEGTDLLIALSSAECCLQKPDTKLGDFSFDERVLEDFSVKLFYYVYKCNYPCGDANVEQINAALTVVRQVYKHSEDFHSGDPWHFTRFFQARLKEACSKVNNADRSGKPEEKGSSATLSATPNTTSYARRSSPLVTAPKQPNSSSLGVGTNDANERVENKVSPAIVLRPM